MNEPRDENLPYAVIGNSRIGALIDERGAVNWMCVPRFDGDPVFCSLLDPEHPGGRFAIELEGCASIEQSYLRNTPILRTVMTDTRGATIEIFDFCPRFHQHGRLYAPVTMVRIVHRISGRPRISIDFSPRCEWGAREPQSTFGSHHIRVPIPSYALRLTTDAPLTPILERRKIYIEYGLTFILGPDETLADEPGETGRRLLAETKKYWLNWVRNLAVPFEWQEEVIRAAITLKLNTFDDTGAIIAALTTSIPEAPNTQRNWDYRFCWLRDAYFVVNALNRLGATGSMERYLGFIENIVAEAAGSALQPVYAVNGAAQLEERITGLPGFRSMGPVRSGNLAYIQNQHDVYGAMILGVAHAFFDQRLEQPADSTVFEQLEQLGRRAYESYGLPDAGIWEYRGRTRVHTFSAMMCWAGCERLARIARHLQRVERAIHWQQCADRIHKDIIEHGFNAALNSFTAAFDGDTLDASLLLMAELDFLPLDDPRLRGTVAAIENHLRRGDYLLRYEEPDDFGQPETAFLVCTFWLVQTLALMGEKERARAQFEKLLACRNRFGLLSEDIHPQSLQLWGNFPQTYSMVGIIMCAMRLSKRWDEAF